MKRKTRWGFFPFAALDYKAAQGYLDKKTAAGWVLDQISFKFVARFVPAEGRCHSVDLNLHGPVDGDEDFIQLCQDAGWEFICGIRKMLLFRSMAGRRPAPLQTDEGMEADRFWKKYMRRQMLINAVVLLLFLPSLYLLISRFPGTLTRVFLLYNSRLLQCAAVAGMVVCLIWSSCTMALWYLRFRRHGRLPQRGRAGAWQMGVVLCACWCLWLGACFLNIGEIFGLGKTVDVAWSFERHTATPELCQSYPILTAADLGLEPDQEGRFLDGRASLLVSSLNFIETPVDAMGDERTFYTEHYQCANTLVARMMITARREETAQRRNFVFLGTLDWEEAPGLGFDESWSYPGGSYLLLRQGKTVVLVCASGFDLTQPEYLDIVRARLQLEE